MGPDAAQIHSAKQSSSGTSAASAAWSIAAGPDHFQSTFLQEFHIIHGNVLGLLAGCSPAAHSLAAPTRLEADFAAGALQAVLETGCNAPWRGQDTLRPACCRSCNSSMGSAVEPSVPAPLCLQVCPPRPPCSVTSLAGCSNTRCWTLHLVAASGL